MGARPSRTDRESHGGPQSVGKFLGSAPSARGTR